MKVYFVGYIAALVALLIFDTAAYDLTNLATLRGWPWPLTVSVVDLAWGGAVTATAAAFLATRAV